MFRSSLRCWIGMTFVAALAAGWAESALGQNQGPARPKGRKYALLVGVDGYGKGSLLPRLGFPRRDAENLARALLECGYAKGDVVVMTSQSGGQDFDLVPTADHIRKQLALLFKVVGENDSLLILLSGHGLTIETPAHDGRPAARMGCFCPSDADLRDREPSKFLTLASFYDGLKTCKAATKMLWVDACRVELKSALPGGVSMLEPLAPPPSVAALFACGDNEESWEDAGLAGGLGVFTHFVIEGLGGAADVGSGDKPSDGAITLDELAGYVKENVLQHVRKQRGSVQTPRLVTGNDGAGRVVLVDLSGAGASGSIASRSTGMRLRLIPAGEFWMGSTKEADPDADDDELPRHRVQITKPFYLGMTEVTVGQFRKVVESADHKTEPERDGQGGCGWNEQTKELDGRNPRYSWRFTGFDQADDHPVVNVTWNDAVWFCNELSKRDGLAPYYRLGAGEISAGDGYRLPTEAEWEYACRAGTTTRYWGGDDPETLASRDNVADATFKDRGDVHASWVRFSQLYHWDPITISGRDGYVFTSPVTRYRANAFGLYGMHGNVAEWCWDWYGEDHYARSPAADPVGAEGASFRVIRGGCWGSNPRGVRSAFRSRLVPGYRNDILGFRVARGQSGK